jgi:pyruvate,water dikinase
MLSHAAIVGREYGVPTVTAVGLGTVVIAEGDEVEVDGDTGTVTVFKKS